MSVLVHINGYPGAGKLTLARRLTDAIGGRLVDNHSVYNLALALTEMKSEPYYETLRAMRELAFQRVLELPAETPVVATNAHMTDSGWGNENWDAWTDLARQRGSRLLVVVLDCQADELDRRIASPGRAASRKLTDPKLFNGARSGRVLIDRDGDATLRFDTTDLAPEATFERVLAFVEAERRGAAGG
ncbi:ATP-binding protein [Phenylobacterium sp. J367]|uniref:AAA family ATPase n=1 Tax=Phenylobacterium sp. J367 TaxID=2898435 RepID=UPI0021512203|nr:ATP-binding protein [Phenylobacterium sp. J367]MCR5878537.1 ATP-binding protein [Phenylobacterium sp. J367]